MAFSSRLRLSSLFFLVRNMHDDKSWIKLHRKLHENDMYKGLTSPQRDVFIQVLLMARYKSSKWEWKGEVFETGPGQFVTSLDSIKKRCAKDVSLKNVRTALLKLEKWGFLANKSTKTGRLITVVNWDTYQIKETSTGKDNGKEPAKHRQSIGKEPASNKESKEREESKESITTTTTTTTTESNTKYAVAEAVKKKRCINLLYQSFISTSVNDDIKIKRRSISKSEVYSWLDKLLMSIEPACIKKSFESCRWPYTLEKLGDYILNNTSTDDEILDKLIG